jgi:hypothetical protein
MNRAQILIACALAVISGCATHPISNDHSPLVPSHRVLTHQWLEQAPDTGLLIIKRDAGSMSASCQVRSMINNSAIADMTPKERIELHLPPGTYVLGAKAHGLCGSGGISEASVIIKTGDTLAYRISAGLSGELSIQPTAF